MVHQIEYTLEAIEDLARLPKVYKKRVTSKVVWLAENFDRITPEPLSYELADFFKLRVGDYRAIFDLEEQDNVIVIHMIDHRSQVYKRFKRRLL